LSLTLLLTSLREGKGSEKAKRRLPLRKIVKVAVLPINQLAVGRSVASRVKVHVNGFNLLTILTQGYNHAASH